MSTVVERHVLSDGAIVIVQRISRHYTCYVVSPCLGESPTIHVQHGSLDDCRSVLADLICDDVCECS